MSVELALGRLPSGIFVLSVKRANGETTAMLASWVMQASFDPPIFTAAIERERPLIAWLIPGAQVTISILGEKDKLLMARFAKGVPPGELAFQGLEIIEDGAHAPALADALGYLAGVVMNSMPAGDHIVFAVEIETGGLLGEGPPMVHIRKNGLRY